MTQPNRAPTAVADTGDATEKGGIANGSGGASATGNVLTNDTDPDAGDTKTVTAVSFGTTNGTLGGNAAEWKEHGSYFHFTNGARHWFAYLESEKDAMAYQGFSLTRVYIEEVGQFPSLDPMWKLMATLRSAAGVKCQMRMTANPGGPSHPRLTRHVRRRA